MTTERGTVVLRACKVYKTFQTPTVQIPVLQGVDLEVRQGGSISIRGESGAGKTTLLSILAGMEMPDRGEVIWHDTVLAKRSAAWQARQRTTFMGLIFQAYYMIPELDALDNVLFPARLLGRLSSQQRGRARSLLEKVGLKDRMHHLASQLSGGEKQRVGIARALMNQPSLILADEPTGNLDERTAAGIIDLLLGLCREENTALVLVTHHPEFASQTERQCHLSSGLILQEEPSR